MCALRHAFVPGTHTYYIHGYIPSLLVFHVVDPQTHPALFIACLDISAWTGKSNIGQKCVCVLSVCARFTLSSRMAKNVCVCVCVCVWVLMCMCVCVCKFVCEFAWMARDARILALSTVLCQRERDFITRQPPEGKG